MEKLVSFFNSNFFIALVTIAAGLTALIVYMKQKADFKKDAANIILLEIKNAERNIKTAKNSLNQQGKLSEGLVVMKNESWSKYKYLFVRKLDRDEWDAINDFYTNCELYDEAVNNNTATFLKNEEQIRTSAHRISSLYAQEAIHRIMNGEPAQEVFEDFNKTDSVIDMYLASDAKKPFYIPQKYFNEAKSCLDTLETKLSLGNVGIRLKEIAKIKD